MDPAAWGATESLVLTKLPKDGSFGLRDFCRLRREELGWSCRQLSLLIGKGEDWLSWAEKKEGRISAEEMEKMMVAMGVKWVQLKVGDLPK